MKKSGYIRKETENNPGDGVSVDQLQSSHPGLVLQFSVKITSAKIWAAQVMVEHFRDLTYVHLMRSTIQGDILTVKTAFEILSATFGVKLNRYHAYNGIFSEQPLISAIEDSNQTIKFCGVGSYHKNSIFERKIQTLKLGDTILLLHANIYWPEAITIML